jgi:phage tail sheath protein FI
MPVPTTYPGVYINEFTPGAPIQPVGTSTAAFLGPTAAGPPSEPVRLTSWDAFKRQFGELPLPNHYLWYAVRGYFENGGSDCYVVRVSSAAYDHLVLNDGAAAPVIQVRAAELGVSDPALSVEVSNDDLITGAALYRPEAPGATFLQNTITCASAADAARFRPGDRLTWTGIDAGRDRPVVVRVDGDVLRLGETLSTTYPAGTVRLADLTPDDRTFRLTATAIPVAGQVLELTQAGTTATGTVAGVLIERVSATETSYRVTLAHDLGAGFDLSDPVEVRSFEFRLTVSRAGSSEVTIYAKLGMDPAHPNYYQKLVNTGSGPIVALPVQANTTPAPDNRPVEIPATALSGGTPDDPDALQPSHYVDALNLLRPRTDVNQLVVPDCAGDKAVQVAVMDHCSGLQDRFAVLDAARGAEPFGKGSVSEQLAGLRESKGYGALYYPWLLVAPATGDEPLLVPPSGHIAGIYARTDVRRGVHKAPAGNEAAISGSLGAERILSDADQGILNTDGVNVIRVFTPGARPVVWGARTTATTQDTNWQYVNIRRLFIFLEGSLQEGLRWVVFEPNNQQLWLKAKRTITDFLTRVWRDGGLFGGTPDEAFYVRIDEAINPFSEQQLGRLNIEIGVRPSYPAEFVIVNIGIWPGGSEVSEG